MAIEPYDNEIIDLWALQFMFAVEKKDAKYGRLEVDQVSIRPDSEQITPIKMVDCEELWEANGLNNDHF